MITKYHFSVLDILLIILIVLFPLVFVMLFLGWYKISILDSIPTFNDEIYWYTQVQAMVAYWKPLGYYGYNGTHAEIGTFGPWGVASLLPYAIFGRIFGWELYSPVLANIFFYCMANLLFIALTKPKRNHLICLLFVNIFLYVNILYLFTSMSEPLRYSLAIILCGMTHHLLENKASIFYKYCLFPIILIFSSTIYLLFLLLVPIYLFIILEKYRIIHRIVIALSVSVLVLALISTITMKISAPYPSNNIFNNLQDMSSLIERILTNSRQISLGMIKSQFGLFHGFFSFYMLLYYGVILFLILSLIKNRSKIYKQDGIMTLIALYLLIGFLTAFVTLYSTSPWKLIRGLNVGLTFAIFLLCLCYSNKAISFFIVLSLLGLFSFSLVSSTLFVTLDRYASNAFKNNLESERLILIDLIPISEKNTRWENTVAIYDTNYSHFFLSLPIGVGHNYMMNFTSKSEAKYTIVQKNETFSDLIISFKENKKLIYENDQIFLFVTK